MAPFRRTRYGFALLAALAFGAARSSAADEGAAEKVQQQLLKASVMVLVDKGASIGQGTGALIDAEKRMVLTNYHVVGRHAGEAAVLFPILQNNKPVTDRKLYLDLYKKNGHVKAKVFALDKKRDLALLQLERLPRGAQALRIARETPAEKQAIYSMGNPGHSERLWWFTERTVYKVAPMPPLSKDAKDTREFYIDAVGIWAESRTYQGESGGPLVNEDAELVGVTQGCRTIVSGDQEKHQGLFVEGSEVKAFLESQGLLARLLPPAAKGQPATDKPPTEKPATVTADAAARKEEDAARRLKSAQALAKEGFAEKAKDRYRELIKDFPGTKAAEEAKKLLAALEK